MIVFLKGLLRKPNQFGVNGFATHNTRAVGFGVTLNSKAVFLVEGVIQLEKSKRMHGCIYIAVSECFYFCPRIGCWGS